MPSWTTGIALTVAMLLSATLFVVLGSFGLIRTLIVGAVLFTLVMVVVSARVEGTRRAKDRLAQIVVTSAFMLALLPLVSLVIATIGNGLNRFDVAFFTNSMRSVVGEGGGAVHAITGTLWVTGIATVISVPIGILAAIYLVEYGQGPLARSITFFVDVMTGIPSIVAGLFAYAVFVLIFGPGTKTGIAGAVALCVLMIPVVVRSIEELLKIVPNELREASYALGVPKWLTIVKVVLPTALAGIVTGVMLAIARVIGETAPLLVAAGFTQSLNNNPLDGPMMTLPVFVYRSYVDQGNPASAYLDRAWAGALTLILIVMVLNLAGRLIAARVRSQDRPMTGRKELKSVQTHRGQGPQRLLRRLQGRRRRRADSGTPDRDRLHRSLGLRQVHAAAHPQPDARGDPQGVRQGPGPPGRRRPVRPRRRPRAGPAPGGHGVPAAESRSRPCPSPTTCWPGSGSTTSGCQGARPRNCWRPP